MDDGPYSLLNHDIQTEMCTKGVHLGATKRDKARRRFFGTKTDSELCYLGACACVRACVRACMRLVVRCGACMQSVVQCLHASCKRARAHVCICSCLCARVPASGKKEGEGRYLQM